MNEDIFKIGDIDEQYNKVLDSNFSLLPIYQSKGFIKHIQKRHPNCLKYIDNISNILSTPDYIGSKDEKSIELIKKIDNNILLALNIDKNNQYFYVASLYDVTESKINNRLNSGQLKKYEK